METYGTEIGLGVGAFFTSILAWLKLKPKPENPMTVFQRELDRINNRQDQFEKSLAWISSQTQKDIYIITEDVKEIKEDVKEVKVSMASISSSLTRLNAIQEMKH